MKKLKIGIISLLIVIVGSCVAPVNAWEATNMTLYNIELEGNNIVSFDLFFNLPEGYGEAVSWIGLQKVPFNSNDFTDFGNIWNTYRFGSISDVLNNQSFIDTYGLIGIYPGDSEGFPSFGSQYTSISQSFNVPGIPLDQADNYYIYMWTLLDFFNQFYPDAPLGKLTASGIGDINLFESSDENNEVETHYGITFDTDGGSEVPNQIIRELGMISEPEDPTKDGFIFDGWYSDSELTEAFDFTSPVTRPISLYAKWEQKIDDEQQVIGVPNTGMNTYSENGSADTNDSFSIYLAIIFSVMMAGVLLNRFRDRSE